MGSIDIIKPLFTFLTRAINNFSNIKRKILGNAENWARGCWVRIKYAAPSHVPNSLIQQWPKNLQGLTQESGSAHRQRPTSSPRSSRTSGRSWTSWTGSSSSWWTRTDTSSRTRRWQAASFLVVPYHFSDPHNSESHFSNGPNIRGKLNGHGAWNY